MRHHRSIALVLSTFILGPMVGCQATIELEPGTSVMLMRFADCGDLRAYVAEAYLEALVQSRYGGYGYGWLEDGEAFAPEGDGESGPTDWSETNVQEEGVDEADLVKTDGEWIYVAQRGELTIVASWPPESTERVAAVPVAGDPFALYLYGSSAIVLSRSWSWYDGGQANGDFEYATFVTVVDVTDPETPVTARTVELEGWYVDSRRIGRDLYVVLSRWNEIPYDLWDMLWNDTLPLPDVDWDATDEAREQAADAARELLRPFVAQRVGEMALTELLPRYTDSGEEAELVMGCTEVYHPAGTSLPTVMSVVHVDLDDDPGGEVSGTGLMAEGWLVYASTEHLYVAQSSWWWWWGWGELDAAETHVHRFALEGHDTVYEASGSVPGWVLDRYAMSEYDGYLRVATTDLDLWWGDEQTEEQASNVFVLDQADTALTVVGQVTGIAPGEQIYAARFLGERGYLVTFEQVDPLFTLDLSNPLEPRVVGELEVPGYSSYLHPLGDDHLLAVGMDGTEDGVITGLAVSLFDVGDPAAPALVDRYTLSTGDGWSYSEALWDPHAFTFHRDVLALPAYTWDGDGGFSGLLLLDVDVNTGLSELGRIDHADLVAESECLYADYYGGAEWDEPCGADYWYAWMRRGLMIEDHIYSISDYGLKVNELDDPAVELASVVFWPLEGGR